MVLSKINYDNFSSGHTVEMRFDDDTGYFKMFRKFDTQSKAFSFITSMMTKDTTYDPFG